MKVYLEQINTTEEEKIIIRCYKVNNRIQDIIDFIKSTDTMLAGFQEERVTQINLQDIFYLEAVDNRVFAYTKDETFELKCKLYEFEELYAKRRFFRCSKSCIINLMKIDNTRPILNGRYLALLFSGEEIIISRQYASELKRKLLGGQI